MTITVTHAHVTALPDDPNYDVGADEWNAAHTVSGLGTAAEANVGDFVAVVGGTMTGSLHIKQSGYLIFEDSSGNEVGRIRFDPPNTPDVGGYSTFIGKLAGNAIDTSAAVPSGRYNTFIGHEVGKVCTTGYYNTGVGTDTLQTLSTGYQNTAVGSDALLDLTDGYRNVAVGFNALQQAIHSFNNVAIGYQAGYGCSSSYNVFVGVAAGNAASGQYQTHLGYNAGSKVTTGDGNVLIGINSGTTGTDITSGQYNTFVGSLTGASADVSNAIAIGANAQVDNSNTAVIGAPGTAVKLGINMTAPTARLHLPAGSTTVAPFKLTSGTNLTTAEAGAMEYDGTDLYFTRSGTTREKVITDSIAAGFVAKSGDTMTGSLAIDLGTITAQAAGWTTSQTWNNGAVTFTAAQINITDTASNANSLAFEIKTGGISKFAVTASGIVRNAFGFFCTDNIGLGGYGAWSVFIDANKLTVSSTHLLSWVSTSNAYAGTVDAALGRNAAGVVEVNNGNAGTYRDIKVRTGIATTGLVVPKTSGLGIKVDPDAPTFGWRDLIGAINVKNTGPTAPSFTTYQGGISQYSFGTAGGVVEVFLEYHIPHEYAPNTDMFIHAHWSTIAAPTGNANWLFEIVQAKGYKQAVFEGTAGSAAPITVSVVDAAATAFRHEIAEVQMSAPGGLISPDTGSPSITVSISSGTPTLTSSAALFTAADIGRTVRILGAGAAGVDLDTTVSAFTSTTQITLATNATTTITAQDAYRYRVIDSSLLEVDGLILVRCWRNSTRAADTLDVAPFLHFVDIHYQTTSVAGTKQKNPPFYT